MVESARGRARTPVGRRRPSGQCTPEWASEVGSRRRADPRPRRAPQTRAFDHAARGGPGGGMLGGTERGRPGGFVLRDVAGPIGREREYARRLTRSTPAAATSALTFHARRPHPGRHEPLRSPLPDGARPPRVGGHDPLLDVRSDSPRSVRGLHRGACIGAGRRRGTLPGAAVQRGRSGSTSASSPPRHTRDPLR